MNIKGVAWTARALATILTMSGCDSVAEAHGLRLSQLSVSTLDDKHIAVTWRSSGGERRPEISIGSPCKATKSVVVSEDTTVLVCPDGLDAVELRLSGMWPESQTIVRLELPDGSIAVHALSGSSAEQLPWVANSVGVAARNFLQLGFTHVLSGLDHLLFLAALLLLARSWRELLIAVTLFTLGHSATLALCALAFRPVSPEATEIAIALTLIVLARELWHRQPVSDTRRGYVTVLLFGLIHGLGFASAVQIAGLPISQKVTALLAFNIGVEFGQLAMLTLASAIWMILRRIHSSAELTLSRTTALIVGVAGVFWFWERI